MVLVMHMLFVLMRRRPPRATRTTHSFPTRRSSDLSRQCEQWAPRAQIRERGTRGPARVHVAAARQFDIIADRAADRGVIGGGGFGGATQAGDRKSTRLYSSH